jgi:Ser-tRNA(Ala) deacylase AlaX
MEKQQHREIHVPRAQLDLDLKSSRTREEIIRNIKEKRKVGLPLDEEEIAEMERETEEDHEEINRMYPQRKH